MLVPFGGTSTWRPKSNKHLSLRLICHQNEKLLPFEINVYDMDYINGPPALQWFIHKNLTLHLIFRLFSRVLK